jgi:hypothetical protein
MYDLSIFTGLRWIKRELCFTDTSFVKTFLPPTISCLDNDELPLVVLSTMFVNPMPNSRSFLSSSEHIGLGNRPDRNIHFPVQKSTDVKKIVVDEQGADISNFAAHFSTVFLGGGINVNDHLQKWLPGPA